MTNRLERFKSGTDQHGSHPEDVAAIRSFIGSLIADLTDIQVEWLWREYADQEWSAGWMMVYEDTLVGFRFWLEDEV